MPNEEGCGVQADDLDLVLAADEANLDALLAPVPEFQAAEEVIGVYIENRCDDAATATVAIWHNSVRRISGDPPEEEDLWDADRTGQYLGLSRCTVLRKARRGSLPHRKLDGGAVRFVPAEIRRWADAQPGPRG